MLRTSTFLALILSFGALAQAPTPAPEAAPDEIQPLLTAGFASYLHGDYNAARESYDKAWDIAKLRPSDDPARYEVSKRLAAVRAALGFFSAANASLSLAIGWREQVNGRDDPKIADDLLQSVGYLRALKDYDGALATLNRVVDLHVRAAGGFENGNVADDFSRMAQIYIAMKKPETAIGSVNMALKIRTKLAGPLDPTLIYDLDRLGALYNTGTMEYDKAEETYRRALVIRESIFGKEDADLISDVDGLAYALFGQEKYDEAEPVYRRLVSLWETSTSPEHPMLAVAWHKLAVFYFKQKKYDQAKEAYDKGNAIRTLFLATGLSEQASDTLLQGDKAGAIALYQKALKPLDPPNKVYDELRSQTEKLLADLNKKSNAQWKSARDLTKVPDATAKPEAATKKDDR